MNADHLVREVEVATRVADELDWLPGRWAELEIRDGRVFVHTGNESPAGRERALCSHTFYSDVSGNVHFVTTVHS